VGRDSRNDQFAEAIESVRHGLPQEMALRAAGVKPESITAAEREQLEGAERELLDEMLGYIREAAKTDPAAARWLRSRGVGLDE
jgi:hypothetical protein